MVSTSRNGRLPNHGIMDYTLLEGLIPFFLFFCKFYMPYYRLNKEEFIMFKNDYKGIDERLAQLDVIIGQRSKLTKEKYEEVMSEYKALVELKNARKIAEGKDKKRGIDPNMIISSGVSLIGIAMMLNYEKTDIISTKTLSMVSRLFK